MTRHRPPPCRAHGARPIGPVGALSARLIATPASLCACTRRFGVTLLVPLLVASAPAWAQDGAATAPPELEAGTGPPEAAAGAAASAASAPPDATAPPGSGTLNVN